MNKLPTAKVRLDAQRVRYRVRIEGDECPDPRGVAGKAQQLELLRQLAEVPDLLRCGSEWFQKLVVTHVNGRWQAEMEAVVQDFDPNVVEI